MLEITYLAWVSGGLMLHGYLMYIFGHLKREIEPNPVTWGMFAVSTAILTGLEFVSGAQWEVLILPATCALLSIVVAYECLHRGKMRIESGWDVVSITLSFILIVAAFYVFTKSQRGDISQELATNLYLLFLLLSNLGTIPEFIPILRSTHADPSGERAWPWVVWTLSYIALGILTYRLYGITSIFAVSLMVYPAMNAVLHLWVGILALPGRRRRKMFEAFGPAAE